MTATIVTFGISKGGASKTTSAGVTAYLLSQKQRVLTVDMDSQGNLTNLLTGVSDVCGVFENKTVLEGIQERDVRPYIQQVTENLHLVPSNDYLVQVDDMLHQYKGDRTMALKTALAPVLNDYDWIVIDTPPALSKQTVISVAASDYCVIMFDGSQFCYYGLQKFLDIIEGARGAGSTVKPAGILYSGVDARASDTEVMKETVEEEFPGLLFKTMIRRKAATKRLAILGFQENPELREAITHYKPFVRELKERCQNRTY